MSTDGLKEFSYGGVVVRGEEVCVIIPRRGVIALPKGGADAEEEGHETALREVREETGLTVTPTELIGAYTSEYGTTGRHTIDIAYLCRLDHGEFQLDEGEKQDAAWVALDDMPELAFAGERQALDSLRQQRG